MAISKKRKAEIYSAINDVLTNLQSKDIALGVARDNKSGKHFICVIDIPTRTIFSMGDLLEKKKMS